MARDAKQVAAGAIRAALYVAVSEACNENLTDTERGGFRGAAAVDFCLAPLSRLARPP